MVDNQHWNADWIIKTNLRMIAGLHNHSHTRLFDMCTGHKAERVLYNSRIVHPSSAAPSAWIGIGMRVSQKENEKRLTTLVMLAPILRVLKHHNHDVYINISP